MVVSQRSVLDTVVDLKYKYKYKDLNGLKMRRSVVVCRIKGCGGCPGGGLLSHFASAVKTPFQPASNCTSAPSTTRQDQETDTDSKTNNPTTINTNKIHKTMETPFQSAQLVHNKTPSHLRASQRHTDKRYTLHRQTNGNIHKTQTPTLKKRTITKQNRFQK